MKLYEYAVIYNPVATKEQAERGDKPKSVLLIGIDTVLANTEQEASMVAARKIPVTYADKLDRVQIAIRPF